MSTPLDAVAAPAAPEPTAGIQEQGTKVEEVTVEITDIKASGLPAKVGLFRGVFYVRVKGGQVSQRTKTTKYVQGDEFVATWKDTVKLSGLESSKVEIEVFARRFFFFYKLIKKTESKESLADLLEHANSLELELLEEGQAAGRLIFRISKSISEDHDRILPVHTDSPVPELDSNPVSPASDPGSPEQAI